jgi:1-acyl-sn-glycerol-3-phosphate acyltransferase
VSAAYHRGRWSPSGRRVLKRLDHAAIYAFRRHVVRPARGWFLPPGRAASCAPPRWTAAGAGSAVKAVRLYADGGLADVLYLVTGWAGLLVLPALARALTPAERALLLEGGAAYTAGAAVLCGAARPGAGRLRLPRGRPPRHARRHCPALPAAPLGPAGGVTPPSPFDGGNPVVWAVCIRVLDLALRVLGTVRISGAEHVPRTGGALLAANHVSHLDPVVLLLVAHRCGRKVRIMGVQEVHERPLVGRFVRAGRHIPVVQGSPSRAPLVAAEQALAAGELVLVYPEGTIPEAGAEVAAKGGVGLLTSRAGVPVVPRSRGLERGRCGWRRGGGSRDACTSGRRSPCRTRRTCGARPATSPSAARPRRVRRAAARRAALRPLMRKSRSSAEALVQPGGDPYGPRSAVMRSRRGDGGDPCEGAMRPENATRPRSCGSCATRVPPAAPSSGDVVSLSRSKLAVELDRLAEVA